jgi:GT2 family glycosyltransferase
MYVCVLDSTEQHDCTDRFKLIAANSCFRRAALDAVGGFPLELGRVGAVLLSGEDVELMRRLRNSGWRIRYHGNFCVGHKVSNERITLKWVRSRAYWEGITTMRMARLTNEPPQLRFALKAACATPLAWALSFFDNPQDEWDLRFWYDLGVVVEALRLSPKTARNGSSTP